MSGLIIQGEKISMIILADNIVLLTRKEEKLGRILNELSKTAFVVSSHQPSKTSKSILKK